MSNQYFRRTRSRCKRAELLDGVPPVADWPKPSAADLPPTQWKKYECAHKAVVLWTEDGDEATIRAKTGLTVRRARELAMLCIAPNQNTGKVVGFWACLPGYRRPREKYQRVKAFKDGPNQTGTGLTGALENLFIRYPNLRDRFEEYLCTRKEGSDAPVSLLVFRNIFDKFISLCKEFGLRERNEWPFNVKRRGYEAVRRWHQNWRHGNPARTIRNEMGDEAASNDKIDRTVAMSPKRTKTYLAYERGELDEHHEDAQWSIVSPVGRDFVHVAASRVYALVIRDCASHVALASSTSFRQRYDTRDVLRLVHSALVPPARQNLVFKNQHFAYDKDACYPGELTEFERLTWQILAMDADRAHFSNQMLDSLEHDIGCKVYGERIGEATARYGIEGFFKRLASMAADLPSATGNNPYSAARREPELAAKRWALVGTVAEQALDIHVRNYNVTPNAQCGGLSPIQLLHEMLAKGQLYRSPLGELRQANLFRFLPRHTATLNRKRGPLSMSPFGVNLFGGRYVGPELAKDVELSLCANLGVTVYVQDDARYAFVVPDEFPDRSYPVVLTGAYSDIPHTLEWRRYTFNWRKNMHIKGKVSTASLSMGILRGLGEAAKTNNAAASMLSGTVAFMDRFGRGDMQYVDMPESKRAQMDEFAATMAMMEMEEGDEEAAPSPAVAKRRIIVPSEVVSPAQSKGNSSSFDPFGLL